jgi:hypothetical protein
VQFVSCCSLSYHRAYSVPNAPAAANRGLGASETTSSSRLTRLYLLAFSACQTLGQVAPVRLPVAGGAEHDQVLLGIVSGLAAEFFVVNWRLDIAPQF